MTTAGWLFMILSITFVVTLTGWCYVKVLLAPEPEEDARADEPSPRP